MSAPKRIKPFSQSLWQPPRGLAKPLRVLSQPHRNLGQPLSGLSQPLRGLGQPLYYIIISSYYHIILCQLDFIHLLSFPSADVHLLGHHHTTPDFDRIASQNCLQVHEEDCSLSLQEPG